MIPFFVLFWSSSWFVKTHKLIVMACFQIIHVELQSENCPNLNRKSVIRASKVLHLKISRFHLFHQDFAFSIRISSFPSGFHLYHQDFITLMLVLGLGQLLTTMVKPTLVFIENSNLIQVLPVRNMKLFPSDFFASNSICSNFPDLQPSWSCILVSPRLLCQPHLLLPQPLGRQNCSTSMGLTTILTLRFGEDSWPKSMEIDIYISIVRLNLKRGSIG